MILTWSFMLKNGFIIISYQQYAYRIQIINSRSECSRFRKHRGKTKLFKKQNNKKKDNATKEVISWKTMADHLREPCILHPKVKHEFHERHTPFSVFEKVLSLDILVELLVNETKIY